MSESGNTSSSDTSRCLVRVDSETHKGEWLRMVACPIPHCDAVMGKDYERFASHLSADHGPEDIGLSPGGRRVATDGGQSVDGTEQIEVGGHDVYPDQKSVLPCPVCSASREVYYLGSRNSLTAGDQPRSYTVSGWVCPDCESTLEVTDEDMLGTEHVSWADVIVRSRQAGGDR